MSTDRKTSTISAIIPTCNEAENIVRFLPELIAVQGVEVIVVDGGSSDGTPGIAAAHGVRVLQVQSNKGLQMNAGAGIASGEILLFLHADTRLVPGFAPEIIHALSLPGVVAGAFSLKIDGNGLGLRVIERLVNIRARALQMPYGDQGMFVKRSLFSEVGEYPVQPILEDFEMVRKLKSRGRIKILPLAAITSARRWQELGILKTSLINQAIIIGYLLGVSPAKLAAWYRQER